MKRVFLVLLIIAIAGMVFAGGKSAGSASVQAKEKNIMVASHNAVIEGNPYRVVYAGKDSLLAGFESAKELPYLETWFEKKDQKNYIISKDALGTMTLDDENIVFAY